MVTRATKTPGIPDIRDDNIAEVLRAIKSTLEVRERRSGDELDGFVRFRDLEDLELVTSEGGGIQTPSGSLPVSPGGGGGPSGYNPGTDYTTPPAPTGFEVSGGFTALYLSWDGPPYKNHAYTEIWRAQIDDLGQAALVGTSISNLYADPADYNTEYWYWIRFMSMANVVGPYNSTSGTRGKTGRDIGKDIEALSEEIVNSALWTELGQRIGKIEIDNYIANKTLNSKLEQLEDSHLLNSSRIFELNSVSHTQATAIRVLESRGPSGNRTFFSINRPDAATPGVVGGNALLLGDIWYDTDDNNRSYRWASTFWEEFTPAGTGKVYHQPNDPALWNGTDYVDIDGRKIAEGDLWYDSDDENHPWRWSGDELVWKDFASGDASAEVIELEKTKIGYATLDVASYYGPADSVFDADGLIWNNVPAGHIDYAHSVVNWNTIHGNSSPTDSKLTWNVGLPFAEATKQVGISLDGGTTTATVEQNFVAMKNTDNGLLAQYSVKIDINGYVSGFGLSSSAPTYDAQADSKFIIRADMFSLAPPATPGNPWVSTFPYKKGDLVEMPGGPKMIPHTFQSKADNNVGHTPLWGKAATAADPNPDPWWHDLVVRLPFIATTTTRVIGGIEYPPGVWMSSAYIYDAQIINAMIKDLTADKIRTGKLKADVSVEAGKIYGGAVNIAVSPGSPTFGTGYFMGDDGGTAKFFAGSVPIDRYILWDGQQFKVAGHIVGYSGRIGGINMSANTAGVGMLYTDNVTKTTGDGFYLASDSYMRVGTATGARMEWDNVNKRFTVYGDSGQVMMSSGQGIAWGGIVGIPANIYNSSISLTADGRLVGGGVAGGTIYVGTGGIQAVRTDASNAPLNILNNQVNVSTPQPGVIQLSGGGSATVGGVIMPYYTIKVANAAVYLGPTVITQAYIGYQAVGQAEIAGLSVYRAHIVDAQVDSLQLGGDAVIIPRYAMGVADPAYDQNVGYAASNGGTGNGYGGAVLMCRGDPKPIPNFYLSVDTRAIVFFFNCEMELNPENNNSTFTISVVLASHTAGVTSKFKEFTFGLTNNQPRFAQIGTYVFEHVPKGTYSAHVVAIKKTGNSTPHRIGNQHLTMFAMKR